MKDISLSLSSQRQTVEKLKSLTIVDMEKYQEYFQLAVKSLRLADHLTYVTFPLINEQRLLLKIFDEIYKTIINSINSVLNYESLYKRIKPDNHNIESFEKPQNSKLSKKDFDEISFGNRGYSKSSIESFMKIAKNYNLSNYQIKKIKEIIETNKKHKQSLMEFVKKDKIVILSDNQSVQTLDIFTIKEYLLLAKEFIVNINKRINA